MTRRWTLYVCGFVAFVFMFHLQGVFASSGRLRSMYLLNDSMLQGMYILSLEGPPGAFRLWPTDSTNGTPLAVCGQTVTNGMPVQFSIPGEPTQVWLEVLGAGIGAVVLSFEGTGNAKGFNHTDRLPLFAPDLWLETSPSPPGNWQKTSFETYLTGYHGSNAVPYLSGNNLIPQEMRLVAEAPGDSIKQVQFRITDSTRINGFCVNAIAPGTGSDYMDYSFHQAVDSTNVIANVSGGKATVSIYCKDFGGACLVTADYLDATNRVVLTITNMIPSATSSFGEWSDNFIADFWQQQKAQEWTTNGFGANPPGAAPLYFDRYSDTEPAALGNLRTDGNYSHGAGGDGLTVWQEYRGFWVDGGASFTNAQHVRLSPARKALLVQVMAEDNYLAGIGTGAAVNQPAVQAFNVNAVMQDVAKFYSDPTRGLGIDLYWTVTKFTMPTESHTYTNGEFVVNLYKHTGTNYYTVSDGFAHGEQAVANSTMWVYRDNRLRRESRDTFEVVFGEVNVGAGIFVQKNRNDTMLKDFVKLALPSRIGTRERDGTYMMDSRRNADSNCTSPILDARGSHVNIVNVSEEKYLATETPISSGDFIDLLKYCIAHELYHLIGGTHVEGAGYISGGYSPFGNIKASSAELLLVNLPAKFSILPQL